MPFTPQGPLFGAQLEEDVKQHDPVVTFIEIAAAKELSMAATVVKEAAENPSTPIKVRVVGNYRVVHEGKAYIGGEVLEIPDDAEHKIWLQSGFVEIVKEK
jgi:hypothetical protein